MIVIIIIIIIVIAVNYYLSNNVSDKKGEALLKSNKIDSTFNIWKNIAPAGDKQTLIQNETPIKKELFDKLTSDDLTSINQYSQSLQDFLSVKNKPFDPLFLKSLSYLSSNFNSAKQIMSKIDISHLLPTSILNQIPQIN